jgi:hypothetical protein
MPAARDRGDILKRQASKKPRCGSVVHSAAIQDREGARWALDKILRPFPWLELI